jgi:agmatinase
MPEGRSMKHHMEAHAPILPNRFLALDEEMAAWDEARVAILPVPYDATTSYQPGSRFGPRAIIDASRYLEEYDEELESEPCRVGLYTCPEVEPVAGDPKAMLDRVEGVVSYLIGRGKLVALLGGEHSLTAAAVRAHVSAYGPLSVLQLDAHLDLRDTYQDSAFSHACVMRRVWEVAPVAAVGVRSCSGPEHDWLKDRGGACFWAHEASWDEAWAEAVCRTLQERVYVTIDLDVFDPSVMPAVGTTRLGGGHFASKDGGGETSGCGLRRRGAGADSRPQGPRCSGGQVGIQDGGVSLRLRDHTGPKRRMRI